MEQSKDDLPIYYTNAARIRMSIFDISFEFGLNQAIINPKTKKIEAKHSPTLNVIMSPQHFKELLKIMNNNLVAYEKEFGLINEPPTPKEKKKDEQPKK